MAPMLSERSPRGQEALDDDRSDGGVSAAVARAAADDEDALIKDDGAREIARRRQRSIRCPQGGARVEAQDVAKDSASRLRLAAEIKQRAAKHRGAPCAAGVDRRTRRPCVSSRIVDVNVAEIVRTASSADRIKTSLEHGYRRTSRPPRQPGALAPDIRLRIVDAVIVDRGHRVAAADDMDAPFEHDRCMSTAR